MNLVVVHGDGGRNEPPWNLEVGCFRRVPALTQRKWCSTLKHVNQTYAGTPTFDPTTPLL